MTLVHQFLPFNAEEITAQGNLNIVELIKMVPGSSGMDGEANQFGSNGAEGISNVNLRGLGTQQNFGFNQWKKTSYSSFKNWSRKICKLA